ncbi:zinc finger protein 678-like [Aedes albopictus]|uniref:C2h2-type zn-finger protein n=1 Tax=Aedes albopictus TaxID=7160 RepID=A0ABM1Y717_AEDAL
MEELAGEIVYVKLEPEDPVDYPLPEIEIIANALESDFPTDTERVNQYCRLCLRERPTLYPLMSRVQNVTVPDMIQAVTAICVNPRDNLPQKVCIQCVVRLDYAYNIRKEFAESQRVLKNLAKSKVSKLWECLNDYQKGTLAMTETRSEELLRQHKDIISKRLIRKEEMIKAEPDAKPEDVVEAILDTEQDEATVEGAENVEQVKHGKEDIPDEVEGYDAWEIDSNEDEIDLPPKKKKKNLNHSGQSRFRKILNYKILFDESDIDPNKCYICQEVFSDVTNLELHLPKHKDMVPYSCGKCKGTILETKPIVTVIMVNRHFRMHAGSMQCPECPYRCYKGYCMYNHLKKFHLSDPNEGCTCETCGYKTKHRRTLEMHLRMHKNVDEGRFTCSFCAKKFGTKARLQRHERIHTNERPYGCRYCTKSFTNETTFRAHERSHTGEKGYCCEYCGKGNPTKSALDAHLATVHRLELEKTGQKKPSNKDKNVKIGKPIKCTHEGCNYVAKNRSQYYQHKPLHILKFHCPHCDLRFPTKQRLDMHEYVHTKVKKYCCDVCGKSFRFLNIFTEHMATHNGIRSYACEICNLAFVRERNLKEHMKKHSDVLDYACRHCGKKFRYRADLSKHEKTHKDPEALTKQEIDLGCSDKLDVITEQCDEQNLMEEYLDE